MEEFLKHTFGVQGKIAIVTGGVSGMGLASARALRQAGAYVIVNARNQERLVDNEHRIGHDFDEMLIADLENISEAEQFVRSIGEKHGRIDVFFLNAGVADNLPLGHITSEHFEVGGMIV